VRDELVAETEALVYGDVADLSVWGGAVIDRRAYRRLEGLQRQVADDPTVAVLAGGTGDDREGFFVRPTVAVGSDPTHEIFTREYFAPFLAVRVYDDDAPGGVEEALSLAGASPYALTGAVFGREQGWLAHATDRLRCAAGNLYVNDRPTGAVVGQQPERDQLASHREPAGCQSLASPLTLHSCSRTSMSWT